MKIEICKQCKSEVKLLLDNDICLRCKFNNVKEKTLKIMKKISGWCLTIGGGMFYMSFKALNNDGSTYVVRLMFLMASIVMLIGVIPSILKIKPINEFFMKDKIKTDVSI